MRIRQEFDVNEDVATVWDFFDQPARVAACIPGVEQVDVVDKDTLSVRVTQKVGPIGATFESKVHITERVREEKIQFTSTGKAVRGAVGNFRTTSTVYLQPAGSQTRVVVEAEAALAGMLGSVGQKIVTKQADKVTAQFARKLEEILSGAPAALPEAALAGASVVQAGAARTARARPLAAAGDGWAKLSAGLSALAVLLGLVTLWRVETQR